MEGPMPCSPPPSWMGKPMCSRMETEVGFDPETMEPIRLGEFLSCSQDDPSRQCLSEHRLG